MVQVLKVEFYFASKYVCDMRRRPSVTILQEKYNYLTCVAYTIFSTILNIRLIPDSYLSSICN